MTITYFDDPGPPNHPTTPSHLQTKVSVTTNGTGAFSLTMTIQATDNSPQSMSPLTFNRSGQTSYLIDSGSVDIGSLCFHKAFKVTTSSLGVTRTATVTFTGSVFC
jgi:hypothetical protein